jgi:superfamily II DNA helicase RecQ
MLDNNGILGRNIIVSDPRLTPDEMRLLDGFMLSALELKEELKRQTQTNTITKTGKARKPREGKSTPNTYIDVFRRMGSYQNMPSKMEDIFIGATRQHVGNSNHNAYVIFGLLKSLQHISTESVYTRVNQRRVRGEHISQRYAQELASACRNVLKVFEHHHENITRYIKELESKEDVLDSSFDAKADADGYELDKLTRTPITTEQLRQNLVNAGLSTQEIENHLAGKRIGCNYRLRVSGSVRVNICGHAATEQDENITRYIKGEGLEWLPRLRCYVDLETGEMVGWW